MPKTERNIADPNNHCVINHLRVLAGGIVGERLDRRPQRSKVSSKTAKETPQMPRPLRTIRDTRASHNGIMGGAFAIASPPLFHPGVIGGAQHWLHVW